MTDLSRFSGAYEGVPPWDIGRPQAAFLRLADEGAVRGDVLDVGCGTGEHALLFAARGCNVLGVDLVPRAVELARAKAKARGSKARFVVHDAMRLANLKVRFDAIVDSGVFHVFDDPDRARYVKSLHAVLKPGGRYFVLVFSEREPKEWGGPRRIAPEEIRTAFRDGWVVERIDDARFETNLPEVTGHALLARVRRLG